MAKAPVKKVRVTAAHVNAQRTRAKSDPRPKWDNHETMSTKEYSAHYYSSMRYYHLEKTGKDLKPTIIEWMAANGYPKSDITAFKKTKDWRCGVTEGAIASNLLRGMPPSREDFNGGKNVEEWLRDRIAKIIEDGKIDIDEELAEKKAAAIKASAPVVTIQDRLKEAAGDTGYELEVIIDKFIENPDEFNPKDYKIPNIMRANGVKPPHARIIKSHFNNTRNELIEALDPKCDVQLKEGYGHLTRKNLKKIQEFYDLILNTCDQIAVEAKVSRPVRPKKVKPVEELVKKVAFKTTDDRYGIASIAPSNIIGAQRVVVFNTKTRKIGIYIAKTAEGLSVKGTSIDNFHESSIQKTLRKPEVQLKEYKDMKTAIRQQKWLKSITSIETPLNGRLNSDIIILKAWK